MNIIIKFAKKAIKSYVNAYCKAVLPTFKNGVFPYIYV